MVVADEATAAQARRAVEQTGALVDIGVHASDALPFEAGSFDLVVVHNRNGQLESQTSKGSNVLRECRRVLRSGGRVIVLEKGTPTGLTALFQSRTDPSQFEATLRALEAAGFRAVRTLGDRDGYRFSEGLNVDGSG